VSQLRELVEVIARALADEPQKVRVSEVQHREATLVEVYAAPRDVGKMIGRQGRTIAAMRTLVGVAADREKKRVTLEVRDAPPVS
jgi:predicted RNA-binding protein YlqC (UPF0109 family)